MVRQILLNGIVAGSYYTLFALGFNITFRISRFFNFAHGGVFTSAAYCLWVLHLKAGLGLGLSIVLAVSLAGILGVALDVVVYSALRRRSATPLSLMLASLGLLTIMQNIVSITFGDSTKTLKEGPTTEGVEVLGARITPVQFGLLITTALVLIIFASGLKMSRLGLVLRAVANNPSLSLICGIPESKVFYVAAFLSSCIAGIGASIAALDYDISPNMGFSALMTGVVAVVVGGARDIDLTKASLFGGMLVGAVQHLGLLFLPGAWQDTSLFVCLILFLLLRPEGVIQISRRIV